MRHVICDVCRADTAHLFAERDARKDVLHRRFVSCANCGFIYADPRAEAFDVEQFYGMNYQPVSFVADLHSAGWRQRVAARRGHLEAAYAAAATAVPGNGRFLDIGMGDGSSLVAASEMGFEVHGLELDARLVQQARDCLGCEYAEYGHVETAKLPAGGFDLIYSWHTIEHVIDVDRWLRRIHELLRPGGLLVIGTESAGAIQGRIWMTAFRLVRHTAWPPTSTDHTYWFSAEALRRVLRRAGFEILESKVYENSPRDLLDGSFLQLSNPKHLAARLLYIFSAAVSQVVPRWGGKQVAIARRASYSAPVPEPERPRP